MHLLTDRKEALFAHSIFDVDLEKVGTVIPAVTVLSYLTLLSLKVEVLSSRITSKPRSYCVANTAFHFQSG
jgi:hypothetical protein